MNIKTKLKLILLNTLANNYFRLIMLYEISITVISLLQVHYYQRFPALKAYFSSGGSYFDPKVIITQIFGSYAILMQLLAKLLPTISISKYLNYEAALMIYIVFPFFTIHYLWYRLYRALPRLSQTQLRNLAELGFTSIEERTIRNSLGYERRVRSYRRPFFLNLSDRIIIASTNFNITIEDCRSKLEQLTNIFNLDRKLLNVNSSEIINNQLVFSIEKDMFASINNTSIVNEFNKKVPRIQIGWDTLGNPKFIDLETDFSFGIFGESGSGKSVYTVEIIHQFLALGYKIIIADVNLVDYKELRKCKNVTYYDVTNLDELKEFNNYIDDLINKQIPLAKHILNSEGVTHPLRLKDRSKYPIEPILIFIDEARAVINPKKETRKDYKEIKISLTTNFETGLSQFRKYGICLGLATQRLQQDELGIDFSNIKVLLANGVDETMNNKWCNGEMTEVILGRWYLAKAATTSKGMIKSPFTKPNFSRFQTSSDNTVINRDVATCKQSECCSEKVASHAPCVTVALEESETKAHKKMQHFYKRKAS